MHCECFANITVSFLCWPFLHRSALGEFPLKEPEQELVKPVATEQVPTSLNAARRKAFDLNSEAKIIKHREAGKNRLRPLSEHHADQKRNIIRIAPVFKRLS